MIEPEKDWPFVSLDELADLRTRAALPPPRVLPEAFRNGVKTIHGLATVEWCGFDYKQPRFVRHAFFENGQRIDIEVCIMGPRRLGKPPIRWVYGDLDIHPNDVRYADRPSQSINDPVTRDGDGWLIYDLAQNAAFRNAAQDDIFAGMAFITLAYNNHFVSTVAIERRSVTSSGSVSNMLALVRARGENYLDIEYNLWDMLMDLPPDAPSKVHAQKQLLSIVHSMGCSSI